MAVIINFSSHDLSLCAFLIFCAMTRGSMHKTLLPHPEVQRTSRKTLVGLSYPFFHGTSFLIEGIIDKLQ
jgi:hypothetical protein